jgi:hypothetical protein
MFILLYIINLHVTLLFKDRLLMTFAINGMFENVLASFESLKESQKT